MAFKFFKNIFSNSRKQVPQQDFMWHHGCDSKVLPKNFYEWYKDNPFVFNAIEERAKACANVKFFIKREDGELIENEFTNKLNNPNQYQNKEEFVKQDITFMSIFGTSYQYINKLRDSKPITDTDLLILNTPNVYFPNIDEKDFIFDSLKFKDDKQKIVYNVDSNEFELNNDYLLPFFDSTTFNNPYFSKSRLDSLQYVVSNSQSSLESLNTFLANPGGIGAWVSKGKDASGSLVMTPSERKEAEKAISNEYGSLSGQNPIRIIGSDMDYVSTSLKIGDLKLNETLVNMGLIIFGTFGLPKEAFTALAEGSTFENQKTAYRNFIQSECQSIMNARCNTYNKYIPQSEGKIVASFAHMPIMQENEKERADVMKVKIDVYNAAKSNGGIDDDTYNKLIEELIK